MSLRTLFKRKPRHINVKYIDPKNKLVVIDWLGRKQVVVIPEALTISMSTGKLA